jgi:hypothetical protein
MVDGTGLSRNWSARAGERVATDSEGSEQLCADPAGRRHREHRPS